MEKSYNNRIGYLVYDTQRAITKSLETTLKPHDLTPGQWGLINQLNVAGELSQKELAQITKKEQATITRYLDTLERKELVVRKQHKTDRRSHLVSVTPKARDLIHQIMPQIICTVDRLAEGIDPRDIDTLTITLEALRDNADRISTGE